MTKSLTFAIYLALILLLTVSCLPLLAQNITYPGHFVAEPPTLISLGFEWYIKGDDNRNATAEVFYREAGTNDWESFLPLLRIGNEKCGTPEWNFTTENMFAGSIFNLEPDTEYECKIIICDPDGVYGDPEKIISIKTK